MGDKEIKTQSTESEKNESSDSKVFFIVEPTEEGIQALLDEIYGPEDDEEEAPNKLRY